MKKLSFTALFLLSLYTYSQVYRDTSLNINVIRMDNYDSLKMVENIKFIQNKFGYKVTTPDIVIKSKKYLTISNSFIDVVELLKNMYSYEITIVFTNNPLYESPIILKGATVYDIKTVIIDGTSPDIDLVISHEIGHALGIHHCDDSNCIMFEEPTKDGFCNKCLSFFGR